MSLQFVSLLRKANLHVDLIRAGSGARRLACTFTPFKNGDADGVGYAGDFLLRRGFDVIAFKSTVDDWFQSLLPQDLDAVRSSILSGGYQWCVGYGSSMGGFAAIALSGALGMHRVLAFSPQFRIDQKFDTRWRSCLGNIPVWRHEVGSPTQAEVVLVYDNHGKDAQHAALIRQALPAGSVTDVRLPFSGHPSVYFLQETGELRAFAEAVLAGEPIPRVNRARRFQSVHYCKAFAWSALGRHRFAWALKAVGQALKLSPNDEEALALKRRILSKQRRRRLTGPFNLVRHWARLLKQS